MAGDVLQRGHRHRRLVEEGSLPRDEGVVVMVTSEVVLHRSGGGGGDDLSVGRRLRVQIVEGGLDVFQLDVPGGVGAAPVDQVVVVESGCIK